MHPAVKGMTRAMPARSASFLLPARRMSPPAQRNSRFFMMAWFSTCSSEPVVASHVPRPTTMKISPTCPMVE